MSADRAEALYELLPAVYRQRDAERGYPLRDLVALVAREAEIVDQDLRRLYESWFIETCDEWVVPYIGDLLDVRGSALPTRSPRGDGASSPGERFSRRAEVANTLHYRRGKGTARVLEELARDVTGWPARVVEFFELLSTTQYLNHPRPHSLRTPDLRRSNALEHVDGPFDAAAHTLEARRIAPRRGMYNIPNVGLFLWRLVAYPARLAEPRRIDAAEPRYTFSVLGNDAPLFIHPATGTSREHIAEEINVPAPVRRRALYYALPHPPPDALPADPLENPPPTLYGADLSIALFEGQDAGGEWQLVPRDEVAACDLGDWDRDLPAGVRAAIDPRRGRLKFSGEPAEELRVTYYHGFSDDLGGGQYEREESFTEIAGERLIAVGADAFDTLGEALTEWGGSSSAVIEIRDSRTYEETLPVVTLAADVRLEIRAANGERPALRLGDELVVDGGARSSFEVNGLLVADHTLRVTGELDRLTLVHTTLVPGWSLTPDGEPEHAAEPSLIVAGAAAQVSIRRSILGTLAVDPGAEVTIEDSIVDANDREAAAYEAPAPGGGPGGPLSLSRSTVIGTVFAREIPLAENSIFLGVVTAERRQQGCVRFSHVPLSSRVPRRFKCQPVIPDGASDDEARRLAARVLPSFTSLRYADPGYCQLDRRGPEEIRRGAEDESEMGVFASLRQPQREDALTARLDEYLRAGLEAGLFFAT